MNFKALLGILMMSNAALAAPTVPAAIKNVSVKRTAIGVSVDLTFDKAVQAKQFKPGFERNFVQLVLKGTKMDAARLLPVSESEVQKVFVYPYSLDTTRVRIILKKDNQWAKGKVSIWNSSAKTLRLFLKDQKGGAGADVSAVQKAVATPTASAAENTATEAPESPQESNLIKEVVSNTRDIDIHNPDSVKAALRPDAAVEKASSEEKTGPVGIKSDPTRHFARMAVALFALLALFVGVVMLLKKYSSKLKKLPFGKKERLIQLVATHQLGAKKSISLVKVAGEYMVVGVGNEGISLISKLGPEVNVDKYLEDRFWGGTFEKHLNSYASDPKVAKELDLSEGAPAIEDNSKFKYDGVRDLGERLAVPAAAVAREVTDRVELSPLRASIKEKLTKLKPLA